jgi:glycogen debranching enzyme
MQALKDTMDKLRNEEGLVGIVDIVLNHVAHNSAWIADHPEACFSTENVPRLWPA